MNLRHLTFIAAAAACLLVTSHAHAQYGAPPPPPPGGGYYGPPPPPQRSGLLIGVAGGAGSMIPDCNGCDSEEGFAFGFTIGGFINPRLALMYDASAIIDFEEDFDGNWYTLTNSLNTFAVQYWVQDKIWIKGGAGFARLFLTTDVYDYDVNGLGLMGAAGFELLQNANFALDAQIRLATGFYEENGSSLRLTNASVLLGANWY